MELLEKLGAWLKARLKEPTAWLAIGSLIVTYKLMNPQTWAMWLAVIGAFVGFGLPERGSNEVTKPEAPSAPQPAATIAGYQPEPEPGREGATPKPPPANP
jgi:hypothetical protein